MLGENYNQKNSVMDHQKNSQKDISNLPTNYQTQDMGKLSYGKTNKLVTALYMVTDIMDKEEPLRNKLRNLGAGIISDISSVNVLSNINTEKLTILEARIDEIMSFLEVAKAVSLISEMNCNILKQEFSILTESIVEFRFTVSNKEEKNPAWLADFLEEEQPLFKTLTPDKKEETNKIISIGHGRPTTRIGLQKGSTLLQALNVVERKTLSEVGGMKNISKVSNKNSIRHVNHEGHAPYEAEGFRSGFDILKKQRREEIVKIIQDKGVATIKDIKDSAYGVLITCGEKTLQRELFSMVGDGVLNRSGEKRWSRYSIK